MGRDYLDFEVSIVTTATGQVARVTDSPAGQGEAPFSLPFNPVELAQFMTAVGPPRVASRRLVPAETRVMDVKDYGKRLGDALLAGEVGRLFRSSLSTAKQQGVGLRVRLGLEDAPDLDPIPWEYLFDSELGRFLTLSSQTPLVRSLEALDVPAPVRVSAPLRVLVMVSSPSDVPELAVAHEEELLRATTADLVSSGRLELVVLTQATLGSLQRALLDTFHVFHFIGHGGFDQALGEGVLVLEREDGTAHRVSASRLGTLLHDANGMQLALLNACEGARTSGRDAFSGVAQSLVRQGLPAVVAMQTEISDRAALVFSHEFYSFLTRGLPIDAAICEVRKAMATSDEASEWGTAVLVRSGSDQPFDVSALGSMAEPAPEGRWESLYAAAQASLASATPQAAVPLLEQIASERPDYADVTLLLEAVKAPDARPQLPPPSGPPQPPPEPSRPHRPPGVTQPLPRVTQPLPTGSAAQPPPGPPVGTRPLPAEPRRPAPSGRRRSGTGWRWAVGVLALLLVATVGFMVWAVSIADDVVPDDRPSTSSGPQVSPSAPLDLVVTACGPSAAIPNADAQLMVGCTTAAPVIDGSFDEWDGVEPVPIDAVIYPKSGANPNGVHGQARLLWDRSALYVEVDVVDPVVDTVDEGQPDQYWRGDSISFEIGPDARNLGPRAGVRNGRDRHVIIGIVPGDAARGAINTAAGGDFPAGGGAPEIDAALSRTSDGYRIEARVPWTILGMASPTRGDVLAGQVNISDARLGPWEQQAMISSNAERVLQRRPGIWQPIILGDPD
ncbi:CHAT domain-containing protein [Intrasporangium sp.]|uniref:CHAT domain-containing protein n=1 Tax=Intrasporangium sp. TaxID=1925024 RepID=UPI00293A42F4|nr:CHAT domain-containing protein [Intrasporangium sp.]MDV3222078.1 CHAT domain-containing protein [Intrasporangium sp.]